MYITKNKSKNKNTFRGSFKTNEIDEKAERIFKSKFDFSNFKYINEINLPQTTRDNSKQYSTIDEDYNDDFLLSFRKRFNDIIKKIEGSKKIFEDIEKAKKSHFFNNKKGIYIKKLFFNDYKKPKTNKKIKKLDVKKVIEIQKIFKGFIVRNINSNIDRLKLRQCLVELFCLLLFGNCVKARIRYNFYLLKKYYITAKLYAGEELDFMDRIKFKLPICFYSGTKINDLRSPRIGKEN